ncbi:DUF3907 family protein [Bacillus sp. BHET2]|uniref:DUF3907 family protein n=1 Tax=Bacillus sp. BHET2 TaxID=2583818 RepID=UPI00110D4955|nr:DUF3907 family protein [Bacillus sp. BHET2]TMU86703.1 DUF3907 family protein [Bacillus sp. BHET2]
MNDFMLKTQVQVAQRFLEDAIIQFEGYLNGITIKTLLMEKRGDRAYYEGLLSNLRRLLVYCEEGMDACQRIIQNEPFERNHAERILYKIYHKCIVEYYSPRYKLWFEDGRITYPEGSTIRFRQEPPDCFAGLLRNVEGEFHTLREALFEFESEFRTKRLL